LLQDFALLHDLLGLVSRNTAFLKAQQHMITPFDAVADNSRSNLFQVDESHGARVGKDRAFVD